MADDTWKLFLHFPHTVRQITEIQMLTSQTNKKVSQHRPMEFDAGPSKS